MEEPGKRLLLDIDTGGFDAYVDLMVDGESRQKTRVNANGKRSMFIPIDPALADVPFTVKIVPVSDNKIRIYDLAGITTGPVSEYSSDAKVGEKMAGPNIPSSNPLFAAGAQTAQQVRDQYTTDMIQIAARNSQYLQNSLGNVGQLVGMGIGLGGAQYDADANLNRARQEYTDFMTQQRQLEADRPRVYISPAPPAAKKEEPQIEVQIKHERAIRVVE